MTCQPVAMRSGIYEKAKASKCTGVEYLYHVRIQRCIPFPECRVEVTTRSMTAHH